MLKIIGTFCLDVAKLIIGGVILGSIMQQSYDISLLLRRGAAAVLIFVATGMVTLYFQNNLTSKKS